MEEVNFLTVSQFSRKAALSITTTYRKVAKGDIPAVKVAGQIRIPTWFLEELAARPGGLPAWIRLGVDV